MNRTYVFLIALLLTLGSNCFAQVSSSDISLLHNTATYKDGKEGLVKVLAKNIRFPQDAVMARKLVTIVGILKIDQRGEIVDVGTLHKVGDNYMEAFKSAIQKTKGKWQVPNKTAQYFYAVIPVQYNFQNSGYTLLETNKPSYFQETIVVTVTGRPGAFAGMYEKQERDLIAQVNELYKSEAYTEAIEPMTELVNLQPLHTGYYKTLIALLQKTGNTAVAKHYEQIKALLTITD